MSGKKNKKKKSIIQEAEEVRKINFKQNLEFLWIYYVKWLKSVPNEVWSAQQAKLINSLLKGGHNWKNLKI